VLSRLFRARRRARLQGVEIPGWNKRSLSLTLIWIILSSVLLLKVGWNATQRATVIADNAVQLKSGPFSEAAELAQIPEGALITVRDHYQGWVQIRFSDQPVGWVERKNIRFLAVDTPPVAVN
jgi:uncharacterized protein YraI